MHGNIQKMILVTVVVVTMVSVSFGQRTSATFAGIVTDPSGAVLPGAEAQLTNEGTGAVTQQLTSETGEFVFNFVPAGTYTLRIAMAGFKTYESRSIPLSAAQNVRQTYTLQVGNITDNVTVTGEAPLVNTLSTEQRFAVQALEVKNLPMVNRNITNILEIGSGLTKGSSSTNGMAGSRLRLNGLGGSSMSLSADGTDAKGNASGMTIGGYGGYNKIDVMSTESVAEVQIVKGVIPAEYGSAMAGSLSLITKSGTNEWHGSLFHRYEGSVLSARNPILAREPNSVWNQFGGSLGGPIKRDRAFFFFTYEGYRQRTGVAPAPTVPTPYFRDILLTSLPLPETKLLLDYYPLPNQPYGPTDLLARWIGPGVREANDDHVDFKTDYLVGGGNFSLSFSGGHPYSIQAPLQPLNPQVVNAESRRASANYVIGRGRWTLSTRAGYNQQLAARVEKFWGLKDPKKPETVTGWRSFPVITFPGLTGLNRENRTWGTQPSWSFEQQAALFRGAHSWKFGGILSLPSGGNPDTTGGSITFQTLQDVMRNEPATVTVEAGQPPNRWHMTNFGFFLQDDWRVNRKLVLNLGVRYDRFGHFVVKPWNADQPVSLFNLDGLRNSVTFEWGPLRDANNAFESDNLSIAPRCGFAYTLDNSGDFVVRGGFGVNFQGFEGAALFMEAFTSRAPNIPQSRSFTRAEAAARGLKFPVYMEDVAPLVRAEAGNQPLIGPRFDPKLKPPYAMNYTLGVQRALTSTLMLETAFVGTRGVKFSMARTYNQIDRITGIRPNANDIQGTYLDSSQQTVYFSWQSSLRQQLMRGLLFNIHHTWGKAMSYTGGDVGHGALGDTRNSIEDFNNVKIERSPSSGDITHNIIFDAVYAVPTPFANSVVSRQVLGGWQISGIWKGRTGTPVVISQTGGRPDILDIKGAVNTNCCSFGNLQYLNRAAFQRVDISRDSNRTIRRGNAGAAPLRGPGLTNLDLSLGKSFSLRERTTLELKADMLNALNQTQYATISTNMDDITFGQIVATEPARIIQIQLRLAF